MDASTLDIFKKYSILKHINVPRETYIDFEKFISLLMEMTLR